jgi:GT2 family glycosyltransferase
VIRASIVGLLKSNNGIVFARLNSTRKNDGKITAKIRQMAAAIRRIIPDFSVVIPTRQQPAVLINCLEALSRQQFPANQFEVIVVEERYSADTELAVRLFADHTGIEIQYLLQTGQRGLAGARNQGWRAARARVIAFTTHDAVPQSNWLSAASDCYKRGAQVLSGQIKMPQTTQYCAVNNRTTAPVRHADFTAGNCFCLRTALERVGGFDEAFASAWYEDSDLQFKFIQAGIPILKCPEAVVVGPINPSPGKTVTASERNRRYDALLYKRHPDLFRQRVPPQRGILTPYYGTVVSAVIGLIALLFFSPVAALIFLSIWFLVTLDLFIRQSPKRVVLESVREAALTAITTLFL